MDLLMAGEETERLKFRKLLPSDFDLWLPFHQDPRSTQYWAGLPKDPLTACQQLFDSIFYRYKNNLGGMNALISKQNGKLIGQCGLLIQKVDDNKELEIGYSILPQFWQKGYASEAAKKCKVFAQKNQLGKSVISIIQIDNLPSQKVALHIGMSLDKTTVFKDNQVHIFR
ncbi:MAG: GNAT family N-acetyltransferase, partial [Pricia sp.]|nr:GNAT family N-acetyltransferase [Pricia sp.]